MHKHKKFVASLLMLMSHVLAVSETRADTLSVDVGKAVTISVSAAGTQPFTYQWRKDGIAISGATAASYSISSATTSSAGAYTAVVTNAVGSTISDNAVLTVNATAPVVIAPAITTQPAAQTVTAGNPATFSVVATGTSLRYQWKKNGVDIASGTGSTYTIAAATAADAASYSVAVYNSLAAVTSTAVTLTVNPAVVAPTISTQPVSRTVTEGTGVTFSVVATGTSLNYQWKKNGVNIAGALGSTYAIAATALADAGSYSVAVYNTAAAVNSTSAVLTVNPLVIAPVITLQPVPQTVQEGSSVTFSVLASGTTPSFQWHKNGTAISGAKGTSYTIASATAADAAAYTVVASNSAGSAASNAATLTVNPVVTFTELIPTSYSARGENGAAEGIAQLFDGNINTKWLDFSGTTWVKIVFDAPTMLDAYSLTSGNDASGRDPGAWTLSGSNDGVTWTVIEAHSGESWSSRLLTRDFVLAQRSQAYTQFRFDFTARTGSTTQLAELELFGVKLATVELTPSSYSARGGNGTAEGIAKLFDGNVNTKWLDYSGTTWVQVAFTQPTVLDAYSITSANDAASRDPGTLTLSGSNDGLTWTVIETRTGQTWSSRLSTKDFILAKRTAAYTFYRLNLTARKGSITQAAELELYGATLPLRS